MGGISVVRLIIVVVGNSIADTFSVLTLRKVRNPSTGLYKRRN